MEREFDSYFEKTYETLSDLATLVGPDAAPVVHQAGFYLTRMKNINDGIRKSEKVGGPVFDFISGSFKNLIGCFMASKDDIREVSVLGNGRHYSLDVWNKLLETFPKLLKVVSLFEIGGGIEFSLEENGIRARACLNKDQEIIHIRKECYKILRQLFEKKSLLTFQVEENEKGCEIELFLNLSHSEEFAYECEFKTSKAKVAFSNIFEQYVIGSYEASKLPLHTCLEITEDLNLVRHSEVPNRFTQVLGDHQIIHFSFLFRPVSIIIPCRGRVTKKALLSGAGDTGRGYESTEKQDVNAISTDQCRYIDVFDLICK